MMMVIHGFERQIFVFRGRYLLPENNPHGYCWDGTSFILRIFHVVIVRGGFQFRQLKNISWIRSFITHGRELVQDRAISGRQGFWRSSIRTPRRSISLPLGMLAKGCGISIIGSLVRFTTITSCKETGTNRMKTLSSTWFDEYSNRPR